MWAGRPGSGCEVGALAATAVWDYNRDERYKSDVRQVVHCGLSLRLMSPLRGSLPLQAKGQWILEQNATTTSVALFIWSRFLNRYRRRPAAREARKGARDANRIGGIVGDKVNTSSTASIQSVSCHVSGLVLGGVHRVDRQRAAPIEAIIDRDAKE